MSSPYRVSFMLDHYFGVKTTFQSYQKTQHGIHTSLHIQGLEVDEKPTSSQSQQKIIFSASQLNLSFNVWSSLFHFMPGLNHLLGRMSGLNFSGSFSGVNFQPIRSFPGMTNLSGYFHADSAGGKLDLSGKNVVVSSPYLFSSDWPSMDLDSHYHWIPKSGNSVEIQMDNLTMHTPNLTFTAQGSLSIPSAGVAFSTVQLTSTLEGKNLTQNLINPYLPKHLIHQNLYEWLTHSLVSVQSVENTFQLSGKLNELPFSHSEGILEDKASVEGGGIIPWESWPEFKNVQGTLLFDRTFFAADVRDAQLLNSHVGPVHLEVEDSSPGKPSNFVVDGQGSPTGEDLVNYVLVSPLKNDFLWFHSLQVSGNVGLTLHLLFPMGKGTENSEKDELQGTLNFQDNSVQFKAFSLPMTNVTGKIHFDGFNLSADSPITGKLLGKPWTVSFYPNQLEMAGDFDFSSLSQRFDNPFFKHISGVAPVRISVDLSKELSIEAKSYLKAVQIDLPPPLLKKKGESFPLNADLHEMLDVAGNHVFAGKFSLGALVNGQYESDPNGFEMAAIFHAVWLKQLENPFNPYSNYSEFLSFPNSPLKQKISVQGTLSAVDLGAWVLTLKDVFSSKNQSFFQLPVKTDLNLSVGLLKVFSQAYSKVQVGFFAEENQPSEMSFSGDTLKGSVTFGNPLQAEFDRFTINNPTILLPEKDGSLGDSAKLLTPSILNKVPPLWVHIKHLYWNGEDKGSVSFFSFPLDSGVALRNGHFILSTAEVDFSGDYRLENHKPLVSASVEAHGTDFGLALTQLGFPSKLSKTKGAFVFVGQWNGSPVSMDVSTLNGSLGLEFSDGTLMQIDNPVISRLLGLFSIESLEKHLSLHFSDMKERGFVFSQISGVYLINDGVASTTDLLINGPTLRVDVRGQIDLVHKTMDQTVVALPNIDGGVVLAAGLLGGPVVGVVAWVADKVLMNTFLKGRGVVYQLKGAWE